MTAEHGLPCSTCGHGLHQHEPLHHGAVCFGPVPGGKAKPCGCEACKEAKELHGLEPRCGCKRFVAPKASKESA